MRNLKDKQEKLDRYLHFLDQDKTNLNLLLSVSNCYLELGNWKAAQRYLDQGKQINKNACYSHQGLLNLAIGQLDQAKEAFTAALKQQNTAINRFNLAFCLYLQRELAESFEVLNALPKEEFFRDADILMAKLLHQQQQIEEAVSLLEQSQQKYGCDAESTGILSLLYFDLNDEEQAEILSRQALVFDPSNYEARLVQVLLQLASDEPPINEINALLAFNPYDCRLWFALGMAKLRTVEFSATEEALLKAVELSPDFYDAWISLGWCHLFQNNLAAAEKSYQQATTISPDTAEGWGGLALVNALRPNQAKAKKLIHKTLEIDPDCFLAEIADIIYATHFQSKTARQKFDNVFPNVANQIDITINRALQERDKNKKLH